jgi:peptide/nickel transport system permease protein
MSVQTGESIGLAVSPPQRTVEIETPWRRFLRRFRRQHAGLVALAYLVVLAAIAVVAPAITPYDPNKGVLLERNQGPSAEHWFGTDDLGRDVFSRMLVSARVSLLAAVQATAISIVVGVPFGLLAGYARGWIDSVASRITDAVMAIPALLFALAIVGILGRDVTNAMIAIGLVNAPRFYRVVRGSTLVVREQTFIEAARATGATPARVVLTHVLPNVSSPLIVQASLSMGFAILFEASISFLGLGVQPPEASWGTMLGRSAQFMEDHPYLVVFPGLAIFFTVLAFNVLGDAINDALGRRATMR